MMTEVKIADLKAHLSEYLRSVRRGNEVIVKDRETPVARIVPHGPQSAGLATRPPTRTFREVSKLLNSKTRKKIRLKPGALERAIRDAKMDWLDKWTAAKSTSTPR